MSRLVMFIYWRNTNSNSLFQIFFVHTFKFHQVAPYVLMAMFVLLEAPISMRVEWRCVSITSGEQFVTTSGTAVMPLLSVNNWDMLTLEVSSFYVS